MSLRSLRRGLDGRDELGQAFRIEAVRRIEVFEPGLVDVEDRHRFEFKAVLRQPELRHGPHLFDEDVRRLVHLIHGHFSRDRPQRRLELADQQPAQVFSL